MADRTVLMIPGPIELDADVLRLGVFDDVGERLLHDPVERGLDLGPHLLGAIAEAQKQRVAHGIAQQGQSQRLAGHCLLVHGRQLPARPAGPCARGAAQPGLRVRRLRGGGFLTCAPPPE